MIYFNEFYLKVPRDFRIMVIEGPDGSGKSYMAKEMYNRMGGSDWQNPILTPRFPDNRGDVKIRDLLFKSDMVNHRAGAPFLFMADFAFWFEREIQQTSPNFPRMILDRFIPSVCIYQKLDPIWVIHALCNQAQLPEFRDFFSRIDYVFLNPKNIDEHLTRLRSKSGEDTNAYDPQTIAEVKDNIERYRLFSELISKLPQIDFPYRSVHVIDV